MVRGGNGYLRFASRRLIPFITRSWGRWDLSAANLEDVAAFFRTFYTPDNAVLSIAGDVDEDKPICW
jgi:hypothetical protein